MCGIAGIVRTDGPAPRDELERLTRALAHRGPDGEAVWLDGPIGLGHRRLAVIDPAGGAQPLFGAGGAVVAIVNGEVYNFAALRTELEARGHRFVTRCDAEVVPHGYAEWGDGVLDRLEGMFAFAVWDARARRLLLARDRLGEKPLYLRVTDRELVFASELRPLAGGGAIDRDALVRYLVHEYVPAPRTMIRGVRKLAAGHALAWQDGAVRTWRYWDVPHDDAPRLADLDGAAAELRDRLTAAVDARLVSDVPLGVFLSGGLDSSLIAALAARHGPIDSFTIGFADPSYDESGPARAVARALGTRHHERTVAPADVLALVPRLGALLDEPLGDPSLVPTHLLARFAREHVTVALGGDGADELFAGYPTFAVEAMLGRALATPLAARLAPPLARAARRLPTRGGHFSLDFVADRVLRGAAVDLLERHQRWLAALAPEDALALVPGAGGDPLDALAAWQRPGDRWDRLLAFYCLGYLGHDILPKVDRASMAVGLEVRAPFLDREVIALATRLAPALRLRGRTGKRVVRRAARDLVPAFVLGRKKHGFALPVADWLRGELRPWLEDTLSAARVADCFEPAAVRRLVDEHVSRRRDHRKALWTLLAFESWRASLAE